MSLRRAALAAAMLAASAAFAHVIVFTLELPAYVGNHPGDGGIFTLQWVDQAAAGPKAIVTLYATRTAWSPFDSPDASLLIATDIPYASPVDVWDWDTRDAGEGCWQPYAVIDDPIEGVSSSKAAGRVTITRGANVPPAIWVTTAKTALPDRDAKLTLEWDVDEPDDPSRVDLRWTAGDGDEGVLVSGLPLSPGTRTASYTFDVRRLPPKAVWLKLEIFSGDAGRCDAWWSGFVTGRSDELLDAGSASDAGSAPSDAGPPGPLPRGCGCHTTEAVSLCALALLLLRPRCSRGEAQGR